MKTTIEQTLIPEYNRLLIANKGASIMLETDILETFSKIPVHAISKYLGLKKNKNDNGGTAVVVKDENGTFIIAADVLYHEADSEDQAGNWSYEFTFNEEDVKDAKQYLITDSSFVEVLMNLSKENSLLITNPEFILNLIVHYFVAIKNILDQNASTEEEFELECDGYFIASSLVTNDEKVFSLVPSGEMKRLIKDDSTLEV